MPGAELPMTLSSAAALSRGRRVYRFDDGGPGILVASAVDLDSFHARFLAQWPMTRVADATTDPPAIVIETVSDVGGSLLLRHPGLPDGGLACADAAEAANQLVGTLALELGLRRPTWLSLHAGAAAGDGGLIALPGDSLSGKSTLAMQLAARGLAFFGDDRLMLAPPRDGGRWRGVSLGLTPRVRLPVHPLAGTDYIAFVAARLTIEHRDAADRPLVATVDPASLGGKPFGSAAPLAAIVLPTRVEDPDTLDLRRAAAGETMVALLRQVAAPALASTALVASLRALVAAVPAWRLTFGSSARAADRLLELSRGT